MNTIKKIILIQMLYVFPLIVFAHSGSTPFGSSHSTPFGNASETGNYTPFGSTSETSNYTPFGSKSETENYTPFGNETDNSKSVKLLDITICPMCGEPIANFVNDVCPVCGYEIGNGDALSGTPLDNGMYVLLTLIALYGVCISLRFKRHTKNNHIHKIIYVKI